MDYRVLLWKYLCDGVLAALVGVLVPILGTRGCAHPAVQDHGFLRSKKETLYL